MTGYQIKEGGIFRLESIEDVEIVEFVHQQPFPNYHLYSLKVRAKIVMPNTDCRVIYASAKVTKNGVTLGSGSMEQEAQGSDWWKTGAAIQLTNCAPGEVIKGEVEATWMCLERGDASSAPKTL